MCGRFVVAEVGSELVSVLRVDLVGDDLPAPSYNVAPTDRVAIVLDSAKTEPPTRRLEPARWGLVPSWAKDPSIGARAINARSEELEDKPMFRGAMQQRRAKPAYHRPGRGPEKRRLYQGAGIDLGRCLDVDPREQSPVRGPQLMGSEVACSQGGAAEERDAGFRWGHMLIVDEPRSLRHRPPGACGHGRRRSTGRSDRDSSGRALS